VVIDLLMDVTDLARVPFARSPMDELVHSVAVLAGRPGAEMHRTWVAATRPRLVDLDLSVLSALAGTRGFLPDFLMPPPTTRGRRSPVSWSGSGPPRPSRSGVTSIGWFCRMSYGRCATTRNVSSASWPTSCGRHWRLTATIRRWLNPVRL
jgi:hypothetical protein